MSAIHKVSGERVFNLASDSYICNGVPSKSLPQPPEKSVSPQNNNF